MSSTASSSASRSRASAHALSYSSSVSTLDTSLLSSDVKVDQNGWVDSPRRVGGPILCSLPIHVDRVSDQYNERTGFYSNTLHIVTEAESILRNHGITPKEVLALGRWSSTDPEPEPIPTVLVMMDHQSVNNNWLAAAKQIHRALVGRFQGISVEVIDERLNMRMHCYPVERSHSAFRKWERIANTIVRDYRMNKVEWNAIALWRYGSNSDTSRNRVTLIISVQKSAVGPFETSRRRIQGILAADREEDNVDILFQKAPIEHYSQNPGVLEDACTQGPNPGVSIGIANSSAESSTLGGIVELQFRGHSGWTPYALTCFHCVFAPEGHRVNLLRIRGAEIAFNKALRNTVLPTDDLARKILRVEQPSTVDLKQSIKSTDYDISQIKSGSAFTRWKIQADKIARDPSDGYLDEREEARYNELLGEIANLEKRKVKFQRYLSRNDLGKLFAGTGCGRIKESTNRRGISSDKQKCYMDWALIEVNDWRLHQQDGKVQGNKPFGYFGAQTRNFMHAKSFEGVFTANEDLHKSGRSTQITTGKCNELKVYTVKHEQARGIYHGDLQTVTHEWAIISTNKRHPFAEHGDSGSFVYDSAGQVVGLVFGGIPTQEVTFMSDIRDVFRDIKDVTGAEDVRIA